MKRLADKPFALLGVNSDEDKKALNSVMKEENITWRSWWDREIGGPIATHWQVSTYPTLYVLDAKGVIRYVGEGAGNVDMGEIDKVVEGLLRELAGKHDGSSSK